MQIENRNFWHIDTVFGMKDPIAEESFPIHGFRKEKESKLENQRLIWGDKPALG